MNEISNQIKTVQSGGSSKKDSIGIEYHRKAAKHHEEAARQHLTAAKLHELGEHTKAFKCSILAYGHHRIALDCQREDVKHHTLYDGY